MRQWARRLRAAPLRCLRAAQQTGPAQEQEQEPLQGAAPVGKELAQIELDK